MRDSILCLLVCAAPLLGSGCGAPDSPIGASPHALTLGWSGYTWTVKNGAGLGPGPNNWSSSAGSVFVDGTDSLNLVVRKIGNKWSCAEVYLPTSLGYGTYEFLVKNRSDTIDKNLVEGLFLYADDTHELDIEWSRWGSANNPNNGDFAAQGAPGDFTYWHQDIPAGAWHKARIAWTPASVRYQIEINSTVTQDWTVTGANNFAPRAERVHINNWLFRGRAPSNGAASTMTLASFTFTPL